MAAASPYPTMPAPVRLAKANNVHRKPTRPFDARLLVIKLEAARLKQVMAAQQPLVDINAVDVSAAQNHHLWETVVNTAPIPQQPPVQTTAPNVSNKRATYIPRNAAKHFAATATPKASLTEASKDLKRGKSHEARVKPDLHTDSMPAVHPKQLNAALRLGVSGSEVATAAAEVEPKPAFLAVPAADSRRANRHSRVLLPGTYGKPRQSRVVPAVPGTRLSSKARSQWPEDATSRGDQIPCKSSYKPGDAAKRAAERRKSQIIAAKCKPITINDGTTKTHHREFSFEFADQKRTEIPGPFHSAVAEDVDSQHHATQRPALKPHDRHNWAQESQCGDEMRDHHHHHHLRLHLGRRKSSWTLRDREDTQQALESGGGGSTSASRLQGPLRHKSADAIPDRQGLISDAVRLIKKQEKAKRRQTIVGFFKRL
ncbi:hypothetical protein LTR36_010651 [Oleoguttula mirabilis]|uniref:Uncharacterized protein n=1 Tax=Oleoguttula mirabilis TaxID=1507867 RepID=A0AAV9JRC2_9PEZI|nr:hypothetical protein LTR36_010651 [Oleoguttula mirabilis]